MSTGDAVPPTWQSAVRDVLRPEFLVGMIVFWTTGTAGGAALGAALGRLRTGAPDDLATPAARSRRSTAQVRQPKRKRVRCHR